MPDFSFTSVAYVQSPYKQKFAIPRQPNLVKEAIGKIIFQDGFSDINVIRKIEQFSHLWLVFVFHATISEGWSPLVHPPRLGGKEKVGVFASRSTHRPNPVGISVVKLLDVYRKGSELGLIVSGLDLMDETPILDIKPYIPYADSPDNVSAGFATEPPGSDAEVRFTEQAEEQVQLFEEDYPELKKFICSVLLQDPRPAYRRKEHDSKEYGMSLLDLNIKWTVNHNQFLVLQLEKTTC